MWKRFLWFLMIPATAVCLIALVIVLFPNQPGVTKSNFNRLADDMTKSEVESILGKKYREIPILWGGSKPPERWDVKKIYSWRGAKGDACIEFDTERLIRKSWHDLSVRPIDRVWNWLPRFR